MTNITLLEKHEPTTLDGIIGQTNIVKILKGYVKNNNVPHLLFAGQPGTGKTTIARVLARELFGKYWNKNIIMLNASSDRGIDVIRGTIKDATMYQPIGGAPFKLIFLDEADSLTKDAMLALRETMLRHQAITRFIFAVNDINKMISPIIDRCQVFRFRSIPHNDIKIHLMHIAKAEEIHTSPQHLMLISVLSKGSMRRAINCLQSLSVLDEITEPIIRELLDTVIDETHSRKLLKRVLSTDVEQYEELLFKMVYASGFEPSEIIQGVVNELIALNNPIALNAIVTLAEYDFRISQGANPMLQARCALFRVNQLKNRDNILKEMK